MKISCIVATYGEKNQAYLDLTLKSLKAQVDVELNVIVVSSGEYKSKVSFGQHVHSDERLHYPSAIMTGFRYIDKDSEYLCLLNDDLLLNENCLNNMVQLLKLNPMAIVNPLANCDNHRFYFLDPNLSWPQQLRLTDDFIETTADHVIKSKTPPFGPFFYSEWIALYCTMMTVKAFKDIGGLDVKFQTGQDDLCFSLRGRQKGYRTGILSNAFCLHFSGVAADEHLTPKERSENIEYFNEKWKGIYSVPNPFI